MKLITGTANLLADARPNTQYLKIPNLSVKTLQHRREIHVFPRLERLRILSRCWDVAGNAATIASMKRTALQHNAPANDATAYAGYRFPPDVISYAVWL